MDVNFPLAEFTEVLVAALLGGAIGFDRELRDRPAGLRTHMLVAIASAMFVTLAEALIEIEVDRALVRSDPVRIVEAIVTGVAFLGAGTIFRASGDGIKGLTTAASLLLAAALGVAAALQLWAFAVGVTIFALLVLRVLGIVESRLHRRRKATADAPDDSEVRAPRP